MTLEQVLSAREERVFRQIQLNNKWHLPIISFSMNIPGPVKDSPLIRRGFLAGVDALDGALPAQAIRHRNIHEAATGWEAMYVVDMEPLDLKARTTTIEDTHGLGRLFDMDVLDVSLHKLDRDLVGGKSRDCIVCGAPGRGCASRRSHTVAQLQTAVRAMLRNHFARADAELIEKAAVQSLLDEVHTTPKPGLVDRRNNGSHTDMDISTFEASAKALVPYFRRCAEAGMDTAHLFPEETFPLLRQAGLQAESAMYQATQGINTHKGAIFTMGLLCGAAGRLWDPETPWDPAALCAEVSRMCKAAMEADFSQAIPNSSGTRLYLEQGIRGVRGEAAAGLPILKNIGLPQYSALRDAGLSPNDAGAITLLHLIARAEDTCLIHRGGIDLARQAAQKAAALLPFPSRKALEALDDWFIARDLSPGGAADLLAGVYFLHRLAGKEPEIFDKLF